MTSAFRWDRLVFDQVRRAVFAISCL